MMSGIDVTITGGSVTRGGTQILDGVTLTARAGEVLALVGPNGAGKSTLLGALSGDIPAEGEITIGQRRVSDISLSELARVRSVLTQRLAVDFPFTAGEVIAMGRAPHGCSDPELERRVVADCGVSQFLDRPISRLSGGEQARVHMARVLVQDTPVLMLDEPTAALDFRHAEEILSVARDRARAGSTVIVVLHDLSAAAAWADRVAVLESGRLIAVGCPIETLTEQRVSSVYGRAVEVLIDSAGNPVIQPKRRRYHDCTGH
ncbi:heme ABC transporter ATP-binding protein [Corynebacterium sp. TAE3-ERU12]|uniref:heme ABC transporter ATP-binding protein n=1 Tax=Corynebacterium sp. TAE3-ERU12 TaxID=2849491 RepID=UPI001C4881DC|nr:heme ABC transporter ATP-binding protein [Corynebacterium sp. TAE3-ERU12]MBV7295748.1 heme ABC transporter ATP-binding protein [Corynebacterium sp. TAE3-ERU12]